MKCNSIKCNLLTIGNIPTSYSVSMSYEEQLLWILNKLEKEIIPDINELIEFVNNIDLNFDEINDKIDIINEQITLLVTNYSVLNEKTDKNTQDIIDLNSKINTEINNLDIELKALISANYNSLKNYVDYQDNILQQEIDNINIGNLQLYDPSTGQILPLQQVINNIYESTNVNGLTATEYDGLDLTATDFDNYQITARDFDSNGKNILV